MRDLLILAIFVGLLPVAWKRPYVGALLWAWISIMNPHRLAYGFAYSFPFAQLAAAVTLMAMVKHREQLSAIPMIKVVGVWIAFCVWMVITTIAAIYPGDSQEMLIKVAKIMVMLFVTMVVVVEKQQIQQLIWVFAMSIGLLGIKTGLFTLTGGGSGMVWGPPGSFIAGNNEIGLAFVVVIPSLYYLLQQTRHRWLRYLLYASLGGSALAAFGTQSRGAFLAIAAMSGFLWLKAERKLALGVVLVVGALAVLSFMPDSWHSRMDTINTYQQDRSAMGRINAWYFAFNLAADNLLGGGYSIYKATLFARYAPNPEFVHAAHSIYFQVLGEHGFIGLTLYLLFGLFSWTLAGQLQKRAGNHPDLAWIRHFAAMAKVSLIGFGVGGAFLSLAYFDLPYYLTVTLVVMYRWLNKHEPVLPPGRRHPPHIARRPGVGARHKEVGQ